MTTSSINTNARWSYTADGVTAAFIYDNKIFADSDLKVYVDGVLQTLGTHYTVSGAGSAAGGNVTLIAVPPAAAVVVIVRDVAAKQESKYVDGDTFPAKVVEDDFDRGVILSQQIMAEQTRQVGLASTSTEAYSLDLPAAPTAAQFLTLDAANGIGLDTGATGPAGPTGPIGPTGATGATGPVGPAGNMDGANNLSELTVPATARTNLGLVIGTDVLAPTGDGSGLTGIISGATDAEKANISLNAFRIAVNGGLTAQNMVDGVTDVFTDQTGVDTAASTNQVYDAAGNYYTDVASTIIPQATGTQIGDLTGGGGLAAAWDANLAQVLTASAETAAGSANPIGYAGKDWGSGATKIIDRYKVWSATGGFDSTAAGNTITLRLYGSNTAPTSPTNGTLLHTDSFTNANATIIKDYATGIITTAGYRYHWITVDSVVATSENIGLCEINLFEAVAYNMTLQSVAATALAQP